MKISHQSCVYANTVHTELQLFTPMGVGIVNKAVLTAE